MAHNSMNQLTKFDIFVEKSLVRLLYWYLSIDALCPVLLENPITREASSRREDWGLCHSTCNLMHFRNIDYHLIRHINYHVKELQLSFLLHCLLCRNFNHHISYAKLTIKGIEALPQTVIFYSLLLYNLVSYVHFRYFRLCNLLD